MNARRRKVVIFSITIVVGYLLTWLTVFSAFMGLEYRYVPQYFAASWLSGGELPATIQLFSLSTTVVSTVVILAASHLRGKRANAET